MGNTTLPPLMEYFSNIEDPRRETKNKKYPLIEVIVIAFLAVMSGADGWESIERYGLMREKMVEKVLDLERRNTQTRCIPASTMRDKKRTIGNLFYELGTGHQTGYISRDYSDRRKNSTRDVDQEPFQGRN